MPKVATSLKGTAFLTAALEGLELQKSRIEEQIKQVRAMLGGHSKPAGRAVAAPEKPAKRRPLSAAARRRIARAQKRRWAVYRKNKAASQGG